MFLFTASAHFTPMKRDLIAMVPPRFRARTCSCWTGIAELAGAIGSLIPATRYWAALGLIVVMVAMLPANISAARNSVLQRSRR